MIPTAAMAAHRNLIALLNRPFMDGDNMARHSVFSRRNQLLQEGWTFLAAPPVFAVAVASGPVKLAPLFMTLTEKILARAAGKGKVEAGDNIWVTADILM